MRGSRRVVTMAAVGAVTAGLLTTSGARAGDADLQLAYTCTFPSGEHQVPVRLTASFPDTAVVGTAVQPTGVTLTATLPPAAVADLTGLGAVVASATIELAVAVSDTGIPADTTWTGLVDAAPLPADGEFVLPTAGDVPAMVPSLVGAMTFIAAGLTLTLNLQREDGSSTDPPFVMAPCALNPDQDGFMAVVVIEQGQVGPPPGTPEECGDIPPIEPELATGCAYVGGYSNVAKLDAAVRIDTGLMNIALANFEIHEGNLLFQHNQGDLPAGGFPPSTATFLTFGFMPIKATMELVQVGPIPVELVAQGGPPFLYWVGATAAMEIRVSDVSVNGVPLDVGPDCRSEEPMTVQLVGGTPEYTNIFLGGPLSGVATIPPFSGCGVGEDLDPLLTGSVSGPDNYIRMMQGNICTPVDPWFCPPTEPDPTPPVR